VVGTGEKSISIMETIQGVKPRDAIGYHTQTIYTPRKGEYRKARKLLENYGSWKPDFQIIYFSYGKDI
jgi:hypothetical protein